MVTPKATEEDRLEAIRLLVAGLAAGQDVSELVVAVAGLHPRDDTFPGEVFMSLAAEVVADTTVAGAGPIAYSGLRERHLADYELVGKENRKFQYAVLCSAAVAGGLDPDLLDEVSWWRTDDFWRYALLAAVALTRAGAECRGVPVAVVVAELAARHEVSIPGM